MDLIPKPGQVVSAAGNVAHRLVYGGMADLRPIHRTLIHDGRQREVYHYEPSADVPSHGDPVLLVTPLAAPSLCYDLRRGCSLVEHLVQAGRPTYLVEYGEVSFRDRNLGIEHWVDDVVPTAVREVSAHAGGRPVHLVGWSLGGTFALLAAATDASLPVASITTLASPFDVQQVPLVAPLRPLLTFPGGYGALNRIYRAAGGLPPLVGWTVQLATFQKLVTRPLAIARHLDDADYLAQIDAVDRFRGEMAAYPGRTFGQLYHRLLKGNTLVHGEFDLGDRVVSVADITVPVYVVAGANDAIAPLASVKPLVPLLSGSPDVRLEIVPGGHLGMLTGREARSSTWPLIDAWIDEWTKAPEAGAPARRTAKRAAKKATRNKAPAKKAAAAKKAPAKKTPAKKTPAAPAEEPTIGVNPIRRYGSEGSRALRR